MKYLRLFLLLLPGLALCAHAADDDDKGSAPQDDVPDFSNLDEFVYQPKGNASVGFRYVSGVKTNFHGNNTISVPSNTTNQIYQWGGLVSLYIAPPESTPPATGFGFTRIYHDGEVEQDTRSQTVLNANGIAASVPILPDGKTNTWTYDTNGQELASGTGTTSQVTGDDYMQFHLYQATSADDLARSKSARGTSGVELRTDHDMGRIGSHFTWSLFAGVSLNDIQANMATNMTAAVTTLTDTYNLYGGAIAPGPAFYPATTTQNITNNGNDVLNSGGNNVTQVADTGVLIGNAPIGHSVTTAIDTVSVLNNFKLHGAYLAFRAGPALNFNFNDHFRFTVSAGPELLDASSTLNVTAVLTPPTGAQEIATFQDVEDKLLPAVYADATLQYDFSEKAGVYLGAFLQEAGNYNQTVSGYAVDSNTSQGSYSTKVDFSTQQGIRGGMTFKF